MNSPTAQNKPFIRSVAGKSVRWTSTLFILVMHLATLAGFWTFSWSALSICLALHWISGGLGITLGFHRLLTHRSFKTPKWAEYFLALCGSLACQGGPISWVAAHRRHHLKPDQEGDPHSPLHGFFWAHMGWCLVQDPLLDEYDRYSSFAPDLARDTGHAFLERTHILWTILLALGLYAWGGWSYVVWGVFVRIVLVYHCTWLVNSAAHIWGYQSYKTPDKSKNCWWVALLTYGEGWHNNHHAFQYSARHGLKWWEFDSTYIAIKTLRFFRLASDLKFPSKEQASRSIL